jgi:hypothetical protein
MSISRNQFGLWLSLVERLPRVQEAVGSNPTSPIFRENQVQKSTAAPISFFDSLIK